MRKHGYVAIAALAIALTSARHAQAGEPGYLGIYLEDEQSSTNGAYVEDVAPDSPAEKAQIKRGDIVSAYNGQAIANSHALIDLLQKASAGDAVTLHVARDDWDKDVAVTFGTRGGEATPPTKDTGQPEGERGFLGVYMAPNPDGAGALVQNVLDASPAAKAMLQKGDVILACDGQDVKDNTALQGLLKSTHPGQKIKLKILRDKWESEVTVELGHRPASATPPTTQETPQTNPQPQGGTGDAAKPAYLGVALSDNDGKGPLKIDDIQANSAADKGGLKPGDVLLGIGDQTVTTIKDFEAAMAHHHAGETVVIRVQRDNWNREIQVVFAEKQG